MTLQEIETKLLSILEIKRINKGLSVEEGDIYTKLNQKYRSKNGHLKKGSYYVNSNGGWNIAGLNP